MRFQHRASRKGVPELTRLIEYAQRFSQRKQVDGRTVHAHIGGVRNCARQSPCVSAARIVRPAGRTRKAHTTPATNSATPSSVSTSGARPRSMKA